MLFFNYSIKIYSTSMTCWREIVTVQAKLFCDHQSVFILNYDKNIENTIFFFLPKNDSISKKYSMFVILIFFIYYWFVINPSFFFCKSYLVHFMWLLMTFIYVLDDLNKNANHDCGCGGGGSHKSG